MSDTRFIGDRIILAIVDGQERDLSSGYTFEIVITRSSDNTEMERIVATAGGTGNSTITASAVTAAATLDAAGEYTYHATLTSTAAGTPPHQVGIGYIDVVKVPGVGA